MNTDNVTTVHNLGITRRSPRAPGMTTPTAEEADVRGHDPRSATVNPTDAHRHMSTPHTMTPSGQHGTLGD